MIKLHNQLVEVWSSLCSILLALTDPLRTWLTGIMHHWWCVHFVQVAVCIIDKVSWNLQLPACVFLSICSGCASWVSAKQVFLLIYPDCFWRSAESHSYYCIFWVICSDLGRSHTAAHIYFSQLWLYPCISSTVEASQQARSYKESTSFHFYWEKARYFCSRIVSCHKQTHRWTILFHLLTNLKYCICCSDSHSIQLPW